MAVSASDMKWRKPTTVATSFSTASVGGAKTSTNMVSGTVDEVFFSTNAEESGGSNVVQYAKVFLANTHATDAASTVGAWVANALDTPGAAAVLKFASSSASDSSSYKIRIKGYNSSGVLITEDRTLNGTTQVTSSLTYSVTSARNVTCEYLNSSDARTNATGTITVTHGSTDIGTIPAGSSFAATGMAIGRTASVDDTQTIADASTAPSGVSFSVANASGDKVLADAGSGDLAAGEAQGYWLRLTLTPAQQAVTPFSFALLASGA